jgi:methionine-S-sulfoxide reductase
MEQAIFAAGHFWGVQYYFDQVPGVKGTTAGYCGGKTEDPTYEDVNSETTGHAEAVLIEYDAREVGYETLVRQFFALHDPTLLNRQGENIGTNFRSAIFYITDAQKETAEQVIAELQPKYGREIVTEVVQAGPFYRAEEEHQKYVERSGNGAAYLQYTAN